MVLIALTFATPVLATGISPTVADVGVEPGGMISSTVFVINDGEEAKIYTLDVIGVDLGQSTDDMNFYILDDETASWFELSQISFRLEPDQVEEVLLTIKPSQSASSKVLVVGVKVLEKASEDDAVRVVSGLVSLVFVTVGQDLIEGAEMLDFSSSSVFTSRLPVTFYTTFDNTGERVIQPIGSVTIENLFGKTVETLEINQNRNRVPNGQVRTFTTTWDDGKKLLSFRLGIFKAKLSVRPWGNGEEIIAEKMIVIVPWRVLVVGLLLLALVIMALSMRRTSRS